MVAWKKGGQVARGAGFRAGLLHSPARRQAGGGDAVQATVAQSRSDGCRDVAACRAADCGAGRRPACRRRTGHFGARAGVAADAARLRCRRQGPGSRAAGPSGAGCESACKLCAPIDRELRNPLHFDRQEWFQAQRAGRDPRDLKKVLQRCWAASDTGQAFRAALEERGYWLAQGERRAVVAIDINGEIFAVARWTGRKTREIVGRTADIEHLPTVAEAQQHIAGLVRIKLSGFIDNIAEDFARPAEQARRLAVELAELPPLEDKWTPYAI